MELGKRELKRLQSLENQMEISIKFEFLFLSFFKNQI